MPLNVMPSPQGERVELDENEVADVKLLMDNYAFQSKFFSRSVLDSDFDYYFTGYNRRDGSWIYGFYYTIELLA